MALRPYSYHFPDGCEGCVYAHNKAHAISSILELNPHQNPLSLSLFLEPEWTSNPLCDSQAANTCPIPKNLPLISQKSLRGDSFES